MMMKIVTYLAIALLLLALGAGAFFYFTMYTPMVADYARLKAGMPELDRAKSELKKYKDKESKEMKETAWINPALDAMSAVLADEIKAGKAEVLATRDSVIVNIAEDEIYMPHSYTFTKASPQVLAKLATLIRDEKIKGKTVLIGNTTDAVPAQRKGRKRIPPKDARTLAADRSYELVKYLVNKGVNADSLVAAAYTSRQPEIGFKLKDHKTVIIIQNPPVLPAVATKQEPSPAPVAAKPAASAAPQPKPIPILPAQPK